MKKKMSLDEQIRKLVEQPGLEKEWYQSMVKRVKMDQRRKMTHINDPVRITKNHGGLKIKLDSLRQLVRQVMSGIRMQKL